MAEFFNTTQRRNVIIYHGGCPDGTASAWCFYHALNDDQLAECKFYPASHSNKKYPSVDNCHVYIVDFSYSKDIIVEMLNKALSVTVLDHHKTSQELSNITHEKFRLVLDMNRSGAQITWDFIHRGKPRPWFINDIADKDLWTWKIPFSQETTRAIDSNDHASSVENFDKLTKVSRNKYKLYGRILRNDDIITYRQHTEHAIRCIFTIGNNTYKVLAVECRSRLASNVGDYILRKNPNIDFAIMYRHNFLQKKWVLSLRSRENGTDVSQIAKQLQGGGHPCASGCSVYNLYEYLEPLAHNEQFD